MDSIIMQQLFLYMLYIIKLENNLLENTCKAQCIDLLKNFILRNVYYFKQQ